MGVEDRSFLCLIQSKVRSWIVDLPWVSGCESWMASGDSNLTVCRNCQLCLVASGGSYLCRSCGRVFCEKCMCSPSDIGSESLRYRVEDETFLPKFCKFCSEIVSPGSSVSEGYREKPDCSVSAFEKPTESEMGKCASINLSCSTTRKFEDERDSGKYLLSPCSVFSQDISDLETSSFSTSTEVYSFKSSPWPSPTRPDQQMEPHRVSSKPNLLVPEHADFSRTPRSEAGDLIESPGVYYENSNLTFQNLEIQDVQKPFDLDNNSLIWLPPPAKDETDESKSDISTNEDEDDNTEGMGTIFKFCSFERDASPTNQKHSDTHMELKKASVYRDFKALVFHFLKVEGICVTSENQEHSWLNIVSSLAWQGANYVRPNTSKGGSMDPGKYVKVKCVLSGSPHTSTLVKGVVCTRNLKHKRMITQHTKPKVLILGGALEYQSISNKFASINTVLEQETDQLKTTFSKIEVHKPNVVLVEKSVSPHVVEYMVAKGISLVSNVKRSLLERIARCTGAHITDLVEDIPSARLGQCEAFHMERVFEECAGGPSSKKLNKTLMFFDGCPRRLGCTVLLRGACLDELKKVKRAVQYASFAAYHLSLETSFLADEGSRFPEVSMSTSSVSQETNTTVGDFSPAPSKSSIYVDMNLPEDSESCSPRDHGPPSPNAQLLYISEEVEMESLLRYDNDSPDVTRDVVSYSAEREMFRDRCNESDECSDLSSDAKENEMKLRSDCVDEDIVSNKNNQSILVSFSKSCVRKCTTCEKPHLFRIKFYGNFDKPLGKYLSDYVFDEMPCQTCKELSDAHVMCYTHQHGNLTISVKRLQSTILPGGTDGNIWMWHRCLRCSHDNGLPPAGRRVKMSDAARGLSFGKFLELSFSSQSTADRVASCGHSLQRDCLRFYGLGWMVACFRYSPVDILLVHLPPSTLEFSSQNQEWLRREATEVSCKIDTLFMEVFDLLYTMELKITSDEYEPTRATLLRDIVDLKDLLRRERNEYDIKLNLHLENWHTDEKTLSILELNGIRRSLLIDSYTWDHRIFLLDSMLKEKISSSEIDLRRAGGAKLERCSEIPHEESLDCLIENDDAKSLEDSEYFGEGGLSGENPEQIGSSLSDTIDLAWTGSSQSIQTQSSISSEPRLDGLHCKRLMSPVRVYSFDSALRSRERTERLCPASILSSTVNASDACEGPGSTYKTSVPNIRRVYSQNSPSDAQTPKFLLGRTPPFISSTPDIASDGARLLLPESVYRNIFVAVHDKEPSSVVSYAISSKEHADFVALVSEQQSGCTGSEKVKDDPLEKQIGSPVSAQQSNSGKDEDNQSRLHGFDDALRSRGSFPSEKKQHHFRFSFDDESSFPTDQVKFSVTCYFARLFYDLRKKCCPKEVNFIGSLSRCRKWSAQGGKSNAYFAKTLDDRFIIKQVTKTELDAFEEFAPQYFDYLTESIESGSPTCLAKILGIYQVNVKHSKVGREEKMDFVVMENIFFGRSVSRVYDLKGSLRSRYVPDTTGSNKVLLDLNLLETLRTNPLFLGSKAKRRLERAVWNDTSFLASVDVMDYSLLVGVDNERKQLVIGIIDFMRQYTWDKQLETWVKASGILGGSKNESPTVVSPDIYKKRFRKAMSSYFLTVPDL